MHVLSISSLKGGVGKTTVTLGLASAAFAKGLRTLVVDLDPQSDASTGMDIEIEGRLNIADVLSNPKDKVVQQAISPSGWTQGHGGTIDVTSRPGEGATFEVRLPMEASDTLVSSGW